MKAVVYDTYGSPDVLEPAEIDEPVVRHDQVLVRVRAASVDPADWQSEVPEAILSLGNGHGRGKTVITVAAVD